MARCKQPGHQPRLRSLSRHRRPAAAPRLGIPRCNHRRLAAKSKAPAIFFNDHGRAGGASNSMEAIVWSPAQAVVNSGERVQSPSIRSTAVENPSRASFSKEMGAARAVHGRRCEGGQYDSIHGHADGHHGTENPPEAMAGGYQQSSGKRVDKSACVGEGAGTD